MPDEASIEDIRRNIHPLWEATNLFMHRLEFFVQGRYQMVPNHELTKELYRLLDSKMPVLAFRIFEPNPYRPSLRRVSVDSEEALARRLHGLDLLAFESDQKLLIIPNVIDTENVYLDEAVEFIKNDINTFQWWMQHADLDNNWPGLRTIVKLLWTSGTSLEITEAALGKIEFDINTEARNLPILDELDRLARGGIDSHNASIHIDPFGARFIHSVKDAAGNDSVSLTEPEPEELKFIKNTTEWVSREQMA